MSIEVVQNLRGRVMPMFQVVQSEYRDRVPAGYPNIIDSPDRGAVGLELDPHYSLYLVTDGEGTFAEIRFRSPRNDSRSSASREKFGGAPNLDRRPIDASISDQGLRNLISELMSRWNFQPLIIHITDSD